LIVKGWETLCEKIHYRGYNTPGCFQEYVVASVTYVVKIPDTLSFLQAAPLLCAGVTSYKALKELGLIVGSYVAIVGAAGGLGHLGVQIAYAMGFRVIAIDTANKVDSCSALGAEFCFACNSPTLVSDIKARTQGGCDGVLCLAYTSSAFTSSMAMIRKKGTLVCIALPPGNFEMPIFDLVMKCITVKGSLVGTRADMTEVMELGARGKVQCNITKGYIKDIST
jgi:propanol-preferring alcohol dehydrogenase